MNVCDAIGMNVCDAVGMHSGYATLLICCLVFTGMYEATENSVVNKIKNVFSYSVSHLCIYSRFDAVLNKQGATSYDGVRQQTGNYW